MQPVPVAEHEKLEGEKDEEREKEEQNSCHKRGGQSIAHVRNDHWFSKRKQQ